MESRRARVGPRPQLVQAPVQVASGLVTMAMKIMIMKMMVLVAIRTRTTRRRGTLKTTERG